MALRIANQADLYFYVCSAVRGLKFLMKILNKTFRIY